MDTGRFSLISERQHLIEASITERLCDAGEKSVIRRKAEELTDGFGDYRHWPQNKAEPERLERHGKKRGPNYDKMKTGDYWTQVIIKINDR